MKNPRVFLKSIAVLLAIFVFFQPENLGAEKKFQCLKRIKEQDALIVQDSEGKILAKKNECEKRVPASTLKVLTALAAIKNFGPTYRFTTEFYLDGKQNLKVKGFGDPLLVSEVLVKIASNLSKIVHHFNHIVLDDTYFASPINIPGRGRSTNPYDAPPGALSSNFNTVVFERNKKGAIISSEPQTPMIPFAEERIRRMNLKKGRYTLMHDTRETTLYTGELLRHFLIKKGVTAKGNVRLGKIDPEDKRIYVFHSPYMLEENIEKMLHFSNNYMANQIMLALGASRFGPPGNLEKGVRALTEFASNDLGLSHVKIVEGSGISRGNRISARDMLTLLNHFKPYRHLLKRDGRELFKTGSLRGIKTRAGYLENNTTGQPCPFVIFFNRSGSDMSAMMDCIKRILAPRIDP